MTVHPAGPGVKNEGGRFRLALLSMPWAIFNRPSIQIGTLKGYVGRECPWATINCHHPYLDLAHELGAEAYHAISRKIWLCESLYAPLVFPEREKGARQVFESELRKVKIAGGKDQKKLAASVAAHLDRTLTIIDWKRYSLVGFSVCFNQLFASLAAAAWIKKRYPDLPIVFGGSSCPEEMVGPLLATGLTDYVICGEGEDGLADLCRYVAGRRVDPGPAVQCRQFSGGQLSNPAQSSRMLQLNNLSTLPTPDYDDYFKEMDLVFKGQRFIPVLPIEFSRGCWWRKCAFCNLNLQWHGYRQKKAEQIVAETVSLAGRHGCLDFTFTDNALPVRQAPLYFQKIAAAGRDYNFFAEIRASFRGDELAGCRAGGLNTVQVGIESLSGSLLARMNKGITVIENMAVMRDSVACGMRLEGNIIVDFPGTVQDEIDATLHALDFVLPFHPLTTASFFLGLGSPVDSQPEKYGIKAVTIHPNVVKICGTGDLARAFLIKGYRGDRLTQKKMWKPVVQKVKAWQDFHHRRGVSAELKPALSWREGGDFLVIRQELPRLPVRHHTLRGMSRRIYLCCMEIHDLKTLETQFPAVRRQQLTAFLDDLVGKRLMFREQEKYLSLAVRAR